MLAAVAVAVGVGLAGGDAALFECWWHCSRDRRQLRRWQQLHPPLPFYFPLLQQFLFLKQKCRSLFIQRKRPAKLAWTTLYRKQHRKVRTQLAGWLPADGMGPVGSLFMALADRRAAAAGQCCAKLGCRPAGGRTRLRTMDDWGRGQGEGCSLARQPS